MEREPRVEALQIGIAAKITSSQARPAMITSAPASSALMNGSTPICATMGPQRSIGLGRQRLGPEAFERRLREAALQIRLVDLRADHRHAERQPVLARDVADDVHGLLRATRWRRS